MSNPANQAQFYWQSAAAGLLLGMALGLVAGVVAAAYLVPRTSADYRGALLALPLLGVLLGSVCGGAAGVAGTVYTSTRGRLPPVLLTAGVSVLTAATLGAVFSRFSATGWAVAALIALPFAIVHGALLPRLAERLRPPPSAAAAALD